MKINMLNMKRVVLTLLVFTSVNAYCKTLQSYGSSMSFPIKTGAIIQDLNNDVFASDVIAKGFSIDLFYTYHLNRRLSVKPQFGYSAHHSDSLDNFFRTSYQEWFAEFMLNFHLSNYIQIGTGPSLGSFNAFMFKEKNVEDNLWLRLIEPFATFGWSSEIVTYIPTSDPYTFVLPMLKHNMKYAYLNDLHFLSSTIQFGIGVDFRY